MKARNSFLQYPEIAPEAVEWLQLDLTDLKSITQLAEEVKKRVSSLNILVSNAATITTSKEIVADRWEKNMAVNVLGSFLLIGRLMPLLETTSKRSGADVRIVTIASTVPKAFLPANFQFQFDSAAGLVTPVTCYPLAWRYFLKFLFASDMILYSVSKAGAMVYASKMQELFDKYGLNILSLIVHPGEVATEGVAEANNAFRRMMARTSFMSSEQGAASPLFAATSDQIRADPDQFKGKLLMPVGKPSSLHSVVNDRKQAQGLWDVMTKELARHLEAEDLAPMRK
ncbi:daunorubicin C-13 ketoreductase [Trichoderma harzianum]|uniref:Daunorubicin C-13 ketoreductase n=1 Tax=Trichoderma harzianum TaxID=5544 RepID=A0A0F9ZET9_TRIHA|nr:daunorubicin C-13 ketoreductase [Trichoderma harzianum]